ncbi:MAG TPA: transposase [Terriglobales bacterium]|jgi:REP element-mobilizing transposase RayT|nr:transposase [Terriglobales bacterium]
MTTKNRASNIPDRSAGVPPALWSASIPRRDEVKIRNRGHLPHWEAEAGNYFITFRLADSIPQSVLKQISSEHESIVRTARQLNRNLSPDERKKIQRLSSKITEHYLDQGAGACHLGNPAVADLAAQALRFFDQKRYSLFAWVIMPNHVHVVAGIFVDYSLASVVHSWKSFTAKKANDLLDCQGAFWQREYYDHLSRNENEFQRAIRYVADNPTKAGLKNWPWVWVWGQDIPIVAGGTPALLKSR